MAELHRTVDRIATIIDAHMMCDETQWVAMKQQMENWKRKWDARHMDIRQSGTSIMAIETWIVVKVLSGEREPKSDANSGI
jgi:hypothetical protein